MSHTNETLHYHLPQYVGTDIINPLVDTNGAYADIDEAIYNVASSAATAVRTANEAQAAIEGAGGVDDRLDGVVTRLDAVEDKDVEQDTAILAAQQAITTANGNIGTLTSNVSDLGTTVAGHTTALANLTTRVGACENADTSLDLRVTALENAPTPSMPTAEDVSFDNTDTHFSSTNVQGVIEEVDSEIHTLETEFRGDIGELKTTTLTAGSTSVTVTFTQTIKATTLITPVCSLYGVNPTNVTYTSNTITLTFEAQSSDATVGARIQNVV